MMNLNYQSERMIKTWGWLPKLSPKSGDCKQETGSEFPQNGEIGGNADVKTSFELDAVPVAKTSCTELVSRLDVYDTSPLTHKSLRGV